MTMYGRLLSGLAIVLVALAVGALGLVGYLWQADDHTGSLTAASAMATFVLASVAVLTLRQNGKLVSAAIDEATATREQATASVDQATASRQTVEEMQREREWAYRPALVMSPEMRYGSDHFIQWQVVVLLNIGTGPAFNVRLAVHRPARTASEGKEAREHRWLSAEWPGLPAGGDVEFSITELFSEPATDGPRPDRFRGIVDDVQSMDGGDVFAVSYDDWFGNHFRSTGPAIRPIEESRGHSSTVDVKGWVRVS
jgi:hypothetical protein